MFRGCVLDTTWLKPNVLADALTDCVTVTALRIDGRYVAESVEGGGKMAR